MALPDLDCRQLMNGATHAQIHRPRQAPEASAQKERWQEVNSDSIGVYLSLRLIHV
jgi:hypothetical protein